MNFDYFYRQLNAEQRRAVDLIDGPMMVLAGPGTGKTQLLSVRTAKILQETDLYPSNILLLTFTNSGVKAMRERLASIMGRSGYDVVVETFHSFANSLINASEESLRFKGNQIEMTDLERVKHLEYLIDHVEGIDAIRHPNNPYLYRKDIEKNISILKGDGVTPELFEDFLQDFKADGKLIEEKHLPRLKAFSKIYDSYEAGKDPMNPSPLFDKRGRYDYDDMILLAQKILEHEPDLFSKIQEQFQYVMVDEFQDTNGSQLKLLMTLFNDPQSNVCVVGDDDQSIYRFQGASTKNFKLFQTHYPAREKVILNVNYRSTSEILATATSLIRTLPEQERLCDKNLKCTHDKNDRQKVASHQFGNIEEELTFIISEIKNMPKEHFSETAVLVRTKKEAATVIQAFLQEGIPYSSDGKENIRGEFRVHQLLKILEFGTKQMEFEERDLMLFEILLFDFWNIRPEDLMQFVRFVNEKKIAFRKMKKRRTSVSKISQHSQNSFDFEVSTPEVSSMIHEGLSLLQEFFLRFPSPGRIPIKDHESPTQEETNHLTICSELHFKDPHTLHLASWALQKLCHRASHYPAYQLTMEFLRDSQLIDFILQQYEHHEVIRLRELRSIGSIVENLKKGNAANPGLQLDQYLEDLKQLERHNIPLAGTMVSSHQEGVKIITAHGSKGLEFRTVIIPFCIQESSWPKKERTDKIPIPHEILLGQEIIASKEEKKQLHLFDEIRLFYVASTRAKDQLIFTASPQKKQICSAFLSLINYNPKNLTSIPEETMLLQFLQKPPRPDPLLFSKETLSGLVKELTLSPSSVNRYLTCPRQFLYDHLLKTPKLKIPSLIYGQCIHEALKKCFQKFIKEGSLPDLHFFETIFKEELDWQGVDTSVHRSCMQKFQDAKSWYESNMLVAIKPLELERRLSKKMPEGLIFIGQFDKVEALGTSNEVRVVDYKTGKPDEHIKALENFPDIFSEQSDGYLRQLIAYKMLYESGYGRKKVKSGELVFLDRVQSTVKKYGLKKDTFISKEIPLHEGMVQDYEKLVLEIWRKIKTLAFDRLPEYDEKKCDFCPYKGVCWKI